MKARIPVSSRNGGFSPPDHSYAAELAMLKYKQKSTPSKQSPLISRRAFSGSLVCASALLAAGARSNAETARVEFRRLEKTSLGYQVVIEYEMPRSTSVELDEIGILPPQGRFAFGTDRTSLIFRDEFGTLIPGAQYNLAEYLKLLSTNLRNSISHHDFLSAGRFAFKLGKDERASMLLSDFTSNDSSALLDVASIKYARGDSTGATLAYQKLADRGSLEGVIGLSRINVANGDLSKASELLKTLSSTTNPSAKRRINTLTTLVDRVAAHHQSIGDALTSLDDFLETALESERPSDADIVLQDQVVGRSKLGANFDPYLAEFVGAQLYRNTFPYFDYQARNVGHWRTQYRRFKQSLIPGSPQGRLAFRITRFIGNESIADGFQFDYALQQLTAPGVPWTSADYSSPLRKKAKEISDRVFASLSAVLA